MPITSLTTRGRSLASATLANTVQRQKLTEDQKLIIVGLINQRKDILFGKRSPTLTAEVRKDAWIEILDECRETYGFDAVSNGKDYLHLRNHVWSDLKQSVVKRLKRGNSADFSNLDLAVLEVIGQQEQPIYSGTNGSIRESSTPPTEMAIATATIEGIEQESPSNQPPLPPPQAVPPPRRIRLIPARRRLPPFEPEAPQQSREPIREPVRIPAQERVRGNNLSTTSAQSTIIGLLPVVDTQSINGRRAPPGTIALQSISLPPKRPRQNEESDEEDEEDCREMKRLRKQLLLEKIQHFQLLNEKLRLEINAMTM